MIAVYKKELKSYFHSVIGWLFMAVLLFFVGMYFMVDCLVYGIPYYSYVLSSVMVIFLFAVPVLTMKILSEEKHQKTDQLLFTAPVRLSGIILGKYLALLTILLLVVLISACYPVILIVNGSIPIAETYVAIAAFFLFGATCIAIGMFLSAITESQVIAAVLTFAILLTGFMMSGLCNIISTTGNWITKILSIFDIATRFDNLLNGIIDVNCVLYYISVIIFSLFLTCQVIQKRRWTMVNYGVIRTAASAGITILVAVLIAAVNIGANFLPASVRSFDITSNQMYSISDTTKNLLDQLDRDIQLTVLNSERNADSTIKEMLSNYESYSKKIKVSYKSQKDFPEIASQYTTDQLADNSMIVACGDKSTVISYSDCFETEIDYQTYQQNTTGYDGEGQVTSAIAYVTSDNLPKVYVITGHQELELSTGVLSNLRKENVDVESINLMNYGAIPEDAASIIISGPVADYTEEDANKVKDYLKAGGHAVILTATTEEELPHFESILSDYGVTIVKGAVFDTAKNSYYQYPFYLLPEIRSHAITRELYEGKRYVLMPQSTGLQVAEEDSMPEGVTATPLLTSTDSSYSKSDLKNMTSYDKEEGDISGPFDLGVYLTKDNEDDSTTKIAVFGCEYLVDDKFDTMVSGANVKLFTSAVSYMVDHEESVSIPSKSYDYSTIMMPQNVIVLWGLMVTIVIPLMMMAMGIVIWAKRRKK
ncbi:MAG: Gldg family protein [Lachnospiraceae bacterium]|nr:Gldg family protein [Lachnospiraceae bacterium]